MADAKKSFEAFAAPLPIFTQPRDHARLVLFRRAETAMQGHIDNPTLANEVIFDWLEDRLGLRKRPS